MPHQEEFLKWERRLASVYRFNPYSYDGFQREKRKIERELDAYVPELTHMLVEERLEIAGRWLERFSTGGVRYPAVWQSFFLCLARFVLDPHLEDFALYPEKIPKIWGRLEQLGQQFRVQESRELLGIAERVREAKKALKRIKGNSVRMRQLKAQTWYACFGSDLMRLLVYGGVLKDLNVLILGPTGSGKELVAQVLLAASEGVWDLKSKFGMEWKTHRTEALNLAEFPKELMAAQIVGYKKGAFTGANRDFNGVLARCNQGSVFLDEIGELSAEGQVILLRALETGLVRALGAETPMPADCRVIAATHRDLENAENCPDFRRDLFYRLAGATIMVPALIEHPEDIGPIAYSFLDEWGIRGLASIHLEDPIEQISSWLESPEVQNHNWPGNIRELKRTLAQCLVGLENRGLQNRATHLAKQDKAMYHSDGPVAPNGAVPSQLVEGTWTLQEVKEWYIHHVLDINDGRQKETAERLDIHRTTIYHTVKKRMVES